MSTRFSLRVFGVSLACLLASALPALSQGVQTGTISGLVSSLDRLPLPGVTVTVVSPALQGEREVVSDSNGVYYVTGLPAGTYRVAFAMSGFQSAARESVQVNIGAIASIDATMSLESIKETVTVTAQMPSPLAQASTTQALTKRDIDVLPVGRRPVDVAELAPSVTANAFNTGQVTIAGSFGYDNVFMVNGVDVNDNIQGTSNNLFIEDAIEDTSVLTHGISAEYGRFSGGVINVVTKSGGNRTSGSFRETLSNPAWIEETPLEKASKISHDGVLGTTHEGTFGGPLLRDRLWYFTAGRYEKANMPNTFAQSGGAYTRTDTNRRGEVKVTSTFLPAQTVQASYINNATEQANTSPISAAALLDAGMLTTRQLPNRLFGVNYNGQLTPSLFATVQFSDKAPGLPPQRRHQQQHHRLAVQDVGGDGGRARRPLLPRAVPRRDRPRAAQQPADRRQPDTLRGDAALRQPRAQRRRRVLRQHRHWRQLPVLHRLRVRDRLSHGQRQHRPRCERCADPGVHARA